MADYIVRIQLRGTSASHKPDYPKVHAAMAERGFSRNFEGKKLPEATYGIRGAWKKEFVLTLAKNAVEDCGFEPEILVLEVNDWAQFGLGPAEKESYSYGH